MTRDESSALEPAVDVKGSYQMELFAETFAHGQRLSEWITKLEKSRIVDPRWAAIAKTHFQEGMMAARRAIMLDKPTF